MYRSTWNRWLKRLNGNRAVLRPLSRRLTLTNLESREVPAAFTPGDLVVLQVGNGTATVSTSAAVPVVLDEYSPSGALVQQIAMPTSTTGGALALTKGGSTFGDGLLSDSADGRYLLIPGYDAAPGTASVASSGTEPRVIGEIGQNGVLNLTTTITDTTGYAERAVASTDGVGIWAADSGYVSAATGGPLRFTTAGTQSTSTGVTTTTIGSQYGVGIANNQLYYSSSTTGSYGVGTVGTGLPTTTGTTETVLPGFPTIVGSGAAAPRQFLFDGPNTIYVADSRTTASTSNLGGLQVWNLVGGSWVDEYTIPMPGNGMGTSYAEGLLSIAGNFSYSNYVANPTLYGVTSETAITNPSKLVAITDGGSIGSSTVTPLVTALANSFDNFDSVAFVPSNPVGTTADTVAINSSNPSQNYGASVNFTATVIGATAPTGWVTFQAANTTSGATTNLGVVPLTGTSGTMSQASISTGSLAVGTYTVKAIYGGDSTYVTNNNTTPQTIIGAATTTVVTSNNALPTTAGVVVTYTATITATSGSAAPTGTVNFYDNGTLLNASPIAVTQVGSTLTATATQTETTNPTQGTNPILLTPGSHTITAVYTPTSGSNFVASDDTTSPLIQNVKVNTFGAGDILVYRDGDGINPTNGNTDNVVYIDEYNPSNNALVQSILMPSFSVLGGNQALTTDAFQAAEGELSLSSDGQYLLLTGYDEALGGGAPDTSAAATTPRTIGEISYNGTINTSMALTDAADGGSIRGAASPNGQQIYVAGSTGGVRFVNGYTAGLTTSTQIDTASNNTTTPLSLQAPVIAGGQLYVSDAATTLTNPAVKIAAVGTGLPTTGGQSDVTLPGLPDPTTGEPSNPVGYWFTDLGVGPFVGPNTLYIANDGSNFYGGDISKWTLVSGTWTLNGTIPSGGTGPTSPVPSFNYVTGTVSGGSNVNLYATFGISGNVSGGSGGLYSIVDNSGYNTFPATTPAITPMATESTTSNEIFRGVAVVPKQPTTVAGVAVTDGNAADGTTQRSEVRQVAVTFSGPVTFAGSGTVNQNAAAAFQLNQINNTTTHFTTPVGVTVNAAVSTNGSGQTVVTLTFPTTGSNVNGGNTGPVDSFSNVGGFGSLNDGRFQMTILSVDVIGANGTLAGGGTNGNYVTPTDVQGGGAGEVGLFRLFGDSLGSGVDDQLALASFRTAFNATGPAAPYVSYLDSDNSNVIDQVDLAQFRQRFNSSIFV